MNRCLPLILIFTALAASSTHANPPSQKECDDAHEAVLEAKKRSKNKNDEEDPAQKPDSAKDPNDPEEIRRRIGIVKLSAEEQAYYQGRMEKLLKLVYPNHDFAKEPI